MALMEKKRYEKKPYEKKPDQRRRLRRQAVRKRRRTGFLVFLGLVVLTIGALILYGTDFTSPTGTESVGRVEPPTVDSSAPDIVSEEESSTKDEESASKDEEDKGEPTPTPPDDPTMYLSVPKLGIDGAVVVDGEAGLELGAQHLDGTGYPWLPNSNTYIAGHRVGWPGTGSDHIFYSLPSLGEGDDVILYDSLGQEYNYRVSEVFAVTPFDVWVAGPTGSDTVTLQVCTESPDDWWTIGPSLMSSGPESGRFIARAERVD
ncbi:MAG: sortase [Rubrobacteraceae bacterium]|jgi:sortase A|nr:sortase [Rubrobacteraceae bacterium]